MAKFRLPQLRTYLTYIVESSARGTHKIGPIKIRKLHPTKYRPIKSLKCYQRSYGTAYSTVQYVSSKVQKRNPKKCETIKKSHTCKQNNSKINNSIEFQSQISSSNTLLSLHQIFFHIYWETSFQ